MVNLIAEGPSYDGDVVNSASRLATRPRLSENGQPRYSFEEVGTAANLKIFPRY